MSNARQKENSLLVAYDKAAQILKKTQSDVICMKTGAVFEEGNYKLLFLGTVYEISMPEVRFITGDAPTIVEVLILHYLTSREENQINGNFISFNGIPGGMFYLKSFQQRVLDKLLVKFEENPEKLIAAGKAIGGKKWTTGDYSAVIPVFPKIDMVVQFFKGDDEFPPEANILFSDSIVNFLPAEDSAFLGGCLLRTLSGS